MNNQQKEALVGAVFQISGGLREVVEPLTDVVLGIVPAETMEADMVAIRSRVSQITGIDLPEALTPDYWKTKKGKEVIGGLRSWQLAEMEIRRCRSVLS